MPALILIYSGIDIFASLSISKDKRKATRQDYIDWCNNYILSNRDLGCHGIDLYAARCSIVHTYTMNSNLSENGKATEIVYSWGKAEPDELQAKLDLAGLNACVVHLDTLAAALREGVTVFIEELEHDKSKADLVINRARKLFKDRPKHV